MRATERRPDMEIADPATGATVADTDRDRRALERIDELQRTLAVDLTTDGVHLDWLEDPDEDIAHAAGTEQESVHDCHAC
jgi:hypothetical protein